MRISDWSSDVCSSDLALARGLAVVAPAFGHGLAVHDGVNARDVADDKAGVRVPVQLGDELPAVVRGGVALDLDLVLGPGLGDLGQLVGLGDLDLFNAQDRKSTRLNSSH